MTQRSDIDISRIPASGVGGLGLLAMAGITVYFVPQLRAVGVPTVLGGVVIGLTLVAIRNRRVRTPGGLAPVCRGGVRRGCHVCAGCVCALGPVESACEARTLPP